MIKEIWKPIDNHPDYEVSNLGRVKSLNYKRTGKEKILNPSSDEYLRVYLNGKGYRIHRLVAQAFIPNPNNLPCINHKNENKYDNRAENLEWCDYSYNVNYGSRNNKVAEKLSKTIFQLDKNGELVKKWDSGRKIRKELGLRPMDNKTNICNGYEWGYADDYEKIPFKVFDLEIYRKKLVNL